MSVEEEEGAEMDDGDGKGGARKHVPSRYLLYGPPAGHSYLTRTNDHHPPSFFHVSTENTLLILLAETFTRLRYFSEIFA